MPETAPLDVSEATVGYELDSITLRNIASVRYVRHHEWLDHLLGDPLPTSAIIPPNISGNLSREDIASQTKKAQAEIAELEAEKEKGWRFHLDEGKAQVLSDAINRLRSDFGSGSVDETQQTVEEVTGVKMIKSSPMRPVKVTYDREAVEADQAKAAQEKLQKRQEEEESASASAKAESPAGDEENAESTMAIDV